MPTRGYQTAGGRVSHYDPAISTTYATGSLWQDCPLLEYLHDPSVGVYLDERFVSYDAAATTSQIRRQVSQEEGDEKDQAGRRSCRSQIGNHQYNAYHGEGGGVDRHYGHLVLAVTLSQDPRQCAFGRHRRGHSRGGEHVGSQR